MMIHSGCSSLLFIVQYSKIWVKISTEGFSVFLVPEYSPQHFSSVSCSRLSIFLYLILDLIQCHFAAVLYCVWTHLPYIDCLLHSVPQQTLVVTVRESLHTCLMWLSNGCKSSTPLTTECTEYADFQMYKIKCVNKLKLTFLFFVCFCVCNEFTVRGWRVQRWQTLVISYINCVQYVLEVNIWVLCRTHFKYREMLYGTS